MRELTPAGVIALLAFGALLLALPAFASGYVLSVTIICLYLAYVGQAWNLMLGFAGLLSIGHALFVGLGAYMAAYLYVKGLSFHFDFGWFGLDFGKHTKISFTVVDTVPPAIGVFAAAGIAALMGSVIGYLGFRFAIGGVYFALLTIAFSEFVRILLDHAKFLGGTEGLFLPVSQESRRGVDLVNLRGWTEMYYYLILALAAGALLLCRALLNSRVGYYWRAIRDNPEAAEAVGVHVFRYRMYAVMLSSAMAGIAGVFYAFYYNNLFPEQVLSIERSIEITLAPIVGGVGTLFGPVFGAFVLTPLGELLTEAVERFKESGIIAKNVKTDGVKLMFWGLAVALIVLLKPAGLWPWACQRLRLVRPSGQRE